MGLHIRLSIPRVPLVSTALSPTLAVHNLTSIGCQIFKPYQTGQTWLLSFAQYTESVLVASSIGGLMYGKCWTVKEETE